MPLSKKRPNTSANSLGNKNMNTNFLGGGIFGTNKA